MKLIMVPVLALAFVGNQGCDLAKIVGADPQSIRNKAENGLRPYFPRVRANIDEQHGLLVAFTCTTNLGPSALQSIVKVLDSNPDVQQLKKYHSLAGLRGFALGFDHDLIVLNLDTGQYRMLSSGQLTGYEQTYGQYCPVLSVNNAADFYVFLGSFRATVKGSDGSSRTMDIQDAMGVYRAAEFEQAKPFELASREEIIRKELSRQGLTLLGLELVSVRQVALPQ